jgi:hypothetical protein
VEWQEILIVNYSVEKSPPQWMLGNDKYLHFLTAILVFIIGGISIWAEPKLIADAPAKLGTLSAFLTAYGLIFTIIELVRTKNATLLAKEESTRVYRSIANILLAKDIEACKQLIRIASDACGRGQAVPAMVIIQIIETYSKAFHDRVSAQDSEYSKNIEILGLYKFSVSVGVVASAKGVTRTKPNKTFQALASMANHLAQLEGVTKNFTEQP